MSRVSYIRLNTRQVRVKNAAKKSVYSSHTSNHHSSSIVPTLVSITCVRGHLGGKEGGRLTGRLRCRIVNNPRNAVDFVDNPPSDGLEETPRKFVRLGAHHVQAGHSSQNADIPVNPGISLHTHGYGTNLSQQTSHVQVCLIWQPCSGLRAR